MTVAAPLADRTLSSQERKPKRLVGLAGRAYAGKDTVSDILRRKHDFARTSFAGPIKDALLILFGLNRGEFDGPGKEIDIEWLGRSPRYLMQTLGTEWGRRLVAEDIWIRHMERRIHYYSAFGGTVITDVRFENEAAWIRARGGEIWHIERAMPQNVVRLHSSEDGIAPREGDSLIDNSRGLEQLEAKVALALAGRARYRVRSCSCEDLTHREDWDSSMPACSCEGSCPCHDRERA